MLVLHGVCPASPPCLCCGGVSHTDWDDLPTTPGVVSRVSGKDLGWNHNNAEQFVDENGSKDPEEQRRWAGVWWGFTFFTAIGALYFVYKASFYRGAAPAAFFCWLLLRWWPWCLVPCRSSLCVEKRLVCLLLSRLQWQSQW
jgi:hypothetical protein